MGCAVEDSTQMVVFLLVLHPPTWVPAIENSIREEIAKGSRSPPGCLLRSCCVSIVVARAQRLGVAWSLVSVANMAQNNGKVQSTINQGHPCFHAQLLWFRRVRVNENTGTTKTQSAKAPRSLLQCRHHSRKLPSQPRKPRVGRERILPHDHKNSIRESAA